MKLYMTNYDCSVEATLDVIGGKWKGIILYHLMNKTLRYNDIKRLMPKITPRSLTRQLRELERDGIIERTIYAEVPPRVEYTVSEIGKTLEPVVTLLGKWGEEHIESVLENRIEAETK